MRLRAIAILTAAAGIGSSAGFSFVVLGDRTGDARHDVFCRVIEEARLLRPDFVLSVGDLIEGYTQNLDSLNAQWDTIMRLVRSLGVPFYSCPGNHDIFDARSESVYSARVGAPFSSFQHGNALFTLVDNSRWGLAESLTPLQIQWFWSELKRAERFRHVFVLMHRPFWRYAREQGRTDNMHVWCRDAGVDCVFCGHDHFYCSDEWDGIRYFQVGPSGSRYKVHQDPAQGAFQNYLHCRVVGDSVAVSVIEPGSVMGPDVVTLDGLRTLERVKVEAVELEPLSVVGGQVLDGKLSLRINNLTEQSQSGWLTWDCGRTGWQIDPCSLSFLVGAGAACRYQFSVELIRPGRVYPLPTLSLPYRYGSGRSTVVRRVLAVQRQGVLTISSVPPVLDAELMDRCWQEAAPLSGFGGKAGGSSPVERTEVWFCRDDSMLYIAARCSESRIGKTVARVSEPDGKVYEDDHLNIVLDFNRESTSRQAGKSPGSDRYFQVFVNSAGTIADRVCRMEGETSQKDYSWNGNWQKATGSGEGFWTVELACPLADFGAVGPEWGVNVVRYQSRFDDIGVWQVPFKHDPRTFGKLGD